MARTGEVSIHPGLSFRIHLWVAWFLVVVGAVGSFAFIPYAYTAFFLGLLLLVVRRIEQPALFWSITFGLAAAAVAYVVSAPAWCTNSTATHGVTICTSITGLRYQGGATATWVVPAAAAIGVGVVAFSATRLFANR